MKNLNITSVYSIVKRTGEKAFIFSIKNPEIPAQFTYYTLEHIYLPKPSIKKLTHAINMLQFEGMELIPIDMSCEEYSIFIKSLSTALEQPKEPKLVAPFEHKNNQKLTFKPKNRF